MNIQTLYMPWDSVHGVLAIRAQRLEDGSIRVDDPQNPQCFPNDLDALENAGYFTDPVQAKQSRKE